MEIVIPPRRDHGASTGNYERDDNGEVTQIRRIPSGEWMGSSPRKAAHDRMISDGSAMTVGRSFHRERAKDRQTVNWPFQSVASEATVTTTSPAAVEWPLRRRRQTWQTPGIRDSDIYSIDGSIVPDYVRNYIRGETPESLAQKRKNNGRLAERDVDLIDQEGMGNSDHQRHRSRAAALEGFRDANSSQSSLGSEMSADDRRRLMRGAGGGDGRRNSLSWSSFSGGWRAGVALNVLIAFVFVAGSVACFAVAMAGTRPARSFLAGPSTIFAGSCAEASEVGYGLGVLVNVIGLVGIAGANYVFQVLTSPTRAEVDLAHAKRRWLDIGIPSARNLRHVAPVRAIMALGLLAVAVISHVIYNSLIFTAQDQAGYNLVYVTESFLSGAPFSNVSSNNAGGLGRLDILALQDLASRDQLVNMTTADCVSRFGGDVSAGFNSALVVTRFEDATNSLVQTASPATLDGRSGINPSVTAAITASSAPLDAEAIRYCLARRVDADSQTCTVQLNGSLLGVVALLNIAALAVTALVLLGTSKVARPLATLGDAIASFLDVPDDTTRGCCLLTKMDVWQKRWGLEEIKYWVPKTNYWFQSASLPRWVFVWSIWITTTGLAATALGMTLMRRGDYMSGRPLSALGSASPTALFLLTAVAEAGASMVAALPQLLVAVLYLATNSLITTFYLSHESAQFASGRPRPLRVSSGAQGEQTSSLFLTLPRPISWVLGLAFAAMGFLVSQSVFVVSASVDGSSSSSSSNDKVVALGFSGTGLLGLVTLLVVVAAAVLGLSLRRAPAVVVINGPTVGNPLVLDAGSCSAVISARCHNTEADEPVDAMARKLAWGVVSPVVRDGMEVAHCAYSARGVEVMDMTKSYA